MRPILRPMPVTRRGHPEAPAPPLGKAAFRGTSWMIFNALATRVTGLLATILLGIWLTQGDFGIYGIAISIAALTAVLREGGVRQYLVSEHRRHDELVGPVFYMALFFNLLNAAVLVGMARFAGLWTDDPAQAEKIAMLLYVAAISAPLGTPGAILQARLMGNLQFGAVSAINSFSALIRYGGAIILAWRFADRLGPLALILSLPVCALFEWVAFSVVNREPLWSRRPEVSRWWSLLAHTKWILLGSLAIVLVNWAPNLALSAVTRDTDLVGVYFMAFNIVVQISFLVSANVGTVLLPAFSKITSEPERLKSAILKAVRQVMLLAGPMSLGLAVIFPPLESLVWRGRWESAAAAVRVLGYAYPFTVLLAVPLAAQQASGHFKQWALGLLAIGLVSVGAAALGGALFHGHAAAAERVAWCTGLSGAAMGLGWTVSIAHRRGIPAPTTIASALPAWMLSVAAAIPVIWFDGRVLESVAPAVRLVSSGGLFTLLFVILARVLIPRHMHEALAMAPAAVSRSCRRAFMLPEETP